MAQNSKKFSLKSTEKKTEKLLFRVFGTYALSSQAEKRLRL
jgi:hypothetical protein